MEKYGKLTIIGLDHQKTYSNGYVVDFVRCRCDCGNEKVINYDDIKRGLVKSCGCITKTANGLSKTRLYQTYRHLINRCYCKKDINYKNYGGRGITVCQEWQNDFMNFYNWAIANGYKDNLTIDRIDNNGNYEPKNCRWVPMQEQRNNKRNNHYITINGIKKTLYEWCDIYGIYPSSVYRRLDKGWDEVKAITYPRREWKTTRGKYER